jgi:uncharacterized protein YidB (DUF937 family)
MKLINHNQNQYYVHTSAEAKQVKRALHGEGKTLQDLAKYLSMSYESLFRKLSVNYPEAYFLENDIIKIKEYCGIEFEIS